MRWLILVAMAATSALACSSDDDDSATTNTTAEATTTTAAPPTAPPTYPAFADVDPFTSEYFISLEDTGLAASQGEERLYNLGINVCQRFDSGQTVEQQLADDAGLGDDWGSIVGAAVSGICPQHQQLVEDYLAANG